MGNSMPSKISISDKTIHTIAYFLLTLSWLLTYKNKASKLKISILIIVLIFFYGIIIEVLQGIVTNYRQPEINDLIANLVGILLAFTIFKMVLQKKLLK
ncbi:VanZ like protein [Lutibacter oceani]|uniref:VanZ like protein n=2 Tax=Lutibacter oceani TaxID=1853311 RepID=A0A3D9RTM0_9FLAO|nr:VanZ like protein [Lutibacter oceani]